MNRLAKKCIIIFIMLTLWVTLVGCKQATEEPSIVGKISKLNKYEDNISILVESENTEKYDYDKAVISIFKNTKIFIGSKEGNMEDIKVGQNVEVVFTGAVRESYPIQADAKIVTILE